MIMLVCPTSLQLLYYSAPVGECNIAISLSVCLSVHEHVSGPAEPIFTKFYVPIPCGCGSVLLWWRCDMLCTSGFMDDILFGRMVMSGSLNRYATTTSGVVVPGCSLMSMNGCSAYYKYVTSVEEFVVQFGKVGVVWKNVPILWSGLCVFLCLYFRKYCASFGMYAWTQRSVIHYCTCVLNFCILF